MSEPFTHTASVQALAALHAAHRALDGYERVVRDATGERVTRQAYVLDGLTRLAIADNMAAIEGATATFETARLALLREHAGGADSFDPGPEGEAAARRYGEALAPLLEQDRTVPIVHISVGALKLDANPIPGSVLAALRPVLRRD